MFLKLFDRNSKSSPDGKNGSLESTVDESSLLESTGKHETHAAWSTAAMTSGLTSNDDSIKPYDDDMANEEIPLVVRAPSKHHYHHGGASSNSSSNKHQKKAASMNTYGEKATVSSKSKKSSGNQIDEIDLGGVEMAAVAARVNETYEANC